MEAKIPFQKPDLDNFQKYNPPVNKSLQTYALFQFSAGLIMGFSPLRMLKVYGSTLWTLRYSLITIAAMIALGQLTSFSSADGTLGLAFAATGFLYPFFGTLLGWLGV